MQLVAQSRIHGEFNGWNGQSMYQFQNGQRWKQAHYRYRYIYKYMPRAKVWRQGSRYYLEVEGMNEMIEVQRA